MIQDRHNVIPVLMAAALHAVFIVSLVVVFDYSRPVKPVTPMMVSATLVSEADLDRPPPRRQPEPEPEPVTEPEPEPEVDNAEQERIAAEELKRQQDLAREQERVRLEEAAEKQRRAKEAAERKRKEEAELERKRLEAEKKREEEIERQRKENERLRAEALAREEQEQRNREILEEEQRLAAMNSSAMARYSFAIQQKIQRAWVKPASAQPGIECVIDVRVARGGDVVSATVGRCNGDAAVRRSIEAAVFKASPLPEPEDPNLFQRDLRITFKPEE